MLPTIQPFVVNHVIIHLQNFCGLVKDPLPHDAVTYANQITKVEAYRPEKGFSDGMKGLCLSGAKVTIPSAVCYCQLTDE